MKQVGVRGNHINASLFICSIHTLCCYCRRYNNNNYYYYYSRVTGINTEMNI
jgi:hypothetical protein